MIWYFGSDDLYLTDRSKGTTILELSGCSPKGVSSSGAYFGALEAAWLSGATSYSLEIAGEEDVKWAIISRYAKFSTSSNLSLSGSLSSNFTCIYSSTTRVSELYLMYAFECYNILIRSFLSHG